MQEIQNLQGTARTLDEVNGELQLEKGLMSRDGYVVIDDSLVVFGKLYIVLHIPTFFHFVYVGFKTFGRNDFAVVQRVFNVKN